jgi:hypothetical protein
MSNREYRVWIDEKPTSWDTPGFKVVTEDDIGEDEPSAYQVARYAGEEFVSEDEESVEVWVATELDQDSAMSFTLDIERTINVSTFENERTVFAKS